MKIKKEKMKKKDCMFQYALNPSRVFMKDPIIENTDLITRKEADKLWEKYLPDFMERLVKGKEPEMVIWTGCKNATDYRNDEKHLYPDEMIVENGRLYKVTKELIYDK